jgi:hypothetical protein
MDIITFINSLTNEDLNRIRNSKSDAEARRLLREHQALQLQQTGVISSLKFRLELNAGRLCEPILQAGKNPKDDAECYKAFLMLAHLEAIEDYLNCL